jgi:hypothetical protein
VTDAGAEAAAGRPPARVGDIARAFSAAVGRRAFAAVLLGATIGGVGSASLGLIMALTPAADVYAAFPFSWLALDDVVMAVLLAAGWIGSLVALTPARVRPAFEAFTWAGERALDAWTRDTGSRVVPTTPAGARTWLASHPETPANMWARGEAMLGAGEPEAARSLADRMPRDTPAQRASQADLAATSDLMLGRQPDLESLRAAADELDGDAAAEARINLALLEARQALTVGDDWIRPLHGVRRSLPASADGILWRGYGWRLFRTALPLLLVAVVAINLLLGACGISTGLR